jgi:predicted transcriptional regulator
MAMTGKAISEQLRRAIIASGMSRYAICKAIDLPQAAMSHFMNRQKGLRLESVDRIGKLLDLRIVAGPTKASKRKGKV